MSSAPTSRISPVPGASPTTLRPAGACHSNPDSNPPAGIRRGVLPLALLAAWCASFGAHGSPAAQQNSWERQIEGLVEQGQLERASALAASIAKGPVAAGSAHAWLGRIAMSQARFEEAASHFARAHEHGLSAIEIAEPWSLSLKRIGRRRDACEVLNDASSADPQRADLRYLAGACLLEAGAPRLAMPHLEAAHRNGVSHAAASMALARAQFGSGREELATELLADVSAASANRGILLEIGKLLFQHVLYRQALQPLRKAWRMGPDTYDVGMYLALSHYQLEQYEDCVEVLRSIESLSAPAEFRYLLGSALARTGDPGAARRELATGIELAPDQAGGYLNLGLFLLDHSAFEEALAVFKHAARRDARGAKVFYKPSRTASCRALALPSAAAEGDRERALYFTDLGDALLAGQQWAAALAVYLAAVEINPGAARAYGGIGLVCQELGTAEVGLQFARRATELDPSDPDLHYYLGSLYQYMSQPKLAVESYGRALRLPGENPARPRYWLRLGMAYMEVGEAAAAEESYRKALQIDSNFAEAHFRLGRIRFSSGRHAEAEALFEKAVRLDPLLTEAYYSWGLACMRNGKTERGLEILESHRKKAALRQGQPGRTR